jgi:hypothetical protein
VRSCASCVRWTSPLAISGAEHTRSRSRGVQIRPAQRSTTSPPADFEEATVIAADVWEQVVAYVENAWKAELLPTI